MSTTETEQKLKDCDLVMKGGITSGVVYPNAIKRIAEEYRLHNIGGASAGAIAAVVAAACEYARQGDRERGVEPDPEAFKRLDPVTKEITGEGFVQGLFQPSPEGKPVLDVALGLVTGPGSKAKLAFGALRAILGRDRLLKAVLWIVVGLWALFAASIVWGLLDGGISWVDGAALAGLGLFTLLTLASAAALVAIGAVARFALAANSALEQNFLGLVPGHNPTESPPALTDWLHETIQTCAGLPSETPLTFELLRGPDAKKPVVDLRLITTDLSYSRPVDLPLTDPKAAAPGAEPLAQYYFDPTQFARFFPADVVAAMKLGDPVVVGGRARDARPPPQPPVVVAARLSLSFPILLSTVPLWSRHPDDEHLVEHCMSDGGISSNFPIHFFDALFPGRPTFGLDLQPYPEERARGGVDEPFVVMGAKRTPGYSGVHTLFEFFPQVLNAARNWRDNMQAELPGYRDRICQIRLTKNQGGLNLTMDQATVELLIDRGAEAGALVCDPKQFSWPRHGFTRFLTLMQMLQEGLGGARKRLGDFRKQVESEEIPGEGWEFAQGHEPPWWTTNAELAGKFLDQVTWGEPQEKEGPPPPDFEPGAPEPKPVLRIIPRV
jgi:predicted acylesterase/phospholipase RssA